MKKLLLSSLLLAFVSIFTFGCSSDSDSSSSSANPGGVGPETVEPSAPADSVTPINLSTPDTLDTLVGTYDITFFYTDAVVTKLTTNCTEAVNKGFVTAGDCSDSDNVTHVGEAVITKTATGIKIATKIQMSGGTFDHPTYSVAVKGQNYQYTEYPEIPFSAITTDVNTGATKVQGTTGRNLTTKTSSPDDTYVFKKQTDGTLLNEMKNKMVIKSGVEVRVIMTKKNDTVIALDPNKPYKSPAVTGFATTPQ